MCRYSHGSFNNSSGVAKLGFCKSWCATISLELLWSWSRATKKTFYVPFSFTDLSNRCNALNVILDRSGEESFFWVLDQVHGSFSDIGAHQDLQKAQFRHAWTINKRTMLQNRVTSDHIHILWREILRLSITEKRLKI